MPAPKRDLVITMLAIAGIVFLVAIFWWWLSRPAPCDTPITCSKDEQCGGTIESGRVCQDGNVYAQGQHNTCLNAGTCTASCSTDYKPWPVQTCKNGCTNGACLTK